MTSVLAIDDSRTIRGMLKMTLEAAGFSVELAEDGVDGIEKLTMLVDEGRPPRLIITDINMPRMDGYGVIAAVRDDQRHRAIPVLVLTTEGDAGKKERARQLGATGWIVKPYDPEKLVAAVRRLTA